MSEPTFKPRSTEGVAHLYTSKLIAFEHRPPHHSCNPPNILLFIGGLGDSILTLPYPAKLAASLPRDWALAEVMISSSGTGWGTGSVKRDADEIAECVAYFRGEGREKVVLMGHSTGCQDVMQYLVGDPNKKGGKEGRDEYEKRPRVQGGILQAPVSDRQAAEAMGYDREIFERAGKLAKEWMDTGRGEGCLPLELTSQFFGTAPVCARRYRALTLPGGDDDFFSSDLGDDVLRATFGRIPKGTKLCILYSGKDEYAPLSLDKEALVERWMEKVKRSEGEVDEVGSGVVEGATHSLIEEGQERAVEECVRRVVGFVEGL